MWFVITLGLLLVGCELIKEYPLRSVIITGVLFGLSMAWSAYCWLKTAEWSSPSLFVVLPQSMQVAVSSYVATCEYRGVAFLIEEVVSVSLNVALGIIAFVVMFFSPSDPK